LASLGLLVLIPFVALATIRLTGAGGPVEGVMDIVDAGFRRDAALLEAARYEVKKVVVGQDHALERLLVCLLAGGHCLLEGLPGLAKTLTVQTLAAVMGGQFARIVRHRRNPGLPGLHGAVRRRTGSDLRQLRAG
jgi:hypothetical protein